MPTTQKEKEWTEQRLLIILLKVTRELEGRRGKRTVRITAADYQRLHFTVQIRTDQSNLKPSRFKSEPCHNRVSTLSRVVVK